MGVPPQKVFSFTPTIHDEPYDFVNPTKLDLSGKYVLIAGASRGLGRSMAVSYAKAGASGIAISGRSSLSSVAGEMQAAAKAASRYVHQLGLPVSLRICIFHLTGGTLPTHESTEPLSSPVLTSYVKFRAPHFASGDGCHCAQVGPGLPPEGRRSLQRPARHCRRQLWCSGKL